MLFGPNARVVRFVPDQPGKGGAKTQVHSHQAGPLLDTYDAFNVHVFYGRWRKESRSYAISGTTNDTISWASSVADVSNGSNIVLWFSGPKWDEVQVGYQVTITSGLNTLVTTITGVAGGTVPLAYDETTMLTANVWPFPNALGATVTIGPVGMRSYVVHPFYKFSTTDAAANATVFILGHDSDRLNNQNRIWNFSSGAVLRETANNVVPATFINIKNRCQICWGGTPNFIFNGTSVYDSGVDEPASAPTYLAGFDPSTRVTTTAYVTHGSTVITEAPPLGVPGNAGHKFGTGSSLVGKTIVLPNGDSTGDDNYTVVSGATIAYGPPGNASGTSGTNQVILATTVLPPNIYNGCYITTTGGTNTNIPIASYVTSANGAGTVITLQSNLAATGSPFTTLTIAGYQLTLNLAYAGITAWSAPATGNIGVLSWVGAGPRYAYAYYDPVTGQSQISNVSPYVQITETNQSNINVILQDIATTGDTRFTKIKIFRTILQGGTYLLALTGGPGQPADLNNTGGPLSFTDIYPDSVLLNGGALQGPYLTNNKPPPFSHMVYWDGRIFGSPVNDPSAIRYSADNVQVVFGVPEECFPSRNVLRIPAADGRVTGCKLIGNQAVIMTERWAYTVVGNNETNYRLIRFSTHMMGVGDYQITEFTGDTTADSDAVCYLGKDQKVYLLAPGLGNVGISAPIQNRLTDTLPDLANYKLARIHTTTIEGRKLVIVRTEENVLMYDYDRKVWTRVLSDLADGTQIAPEAYASLYGDTNPVDELWTFQGQLRGWQRYNSSGTGALSGGYVETFPLTFIDDEKKRRQINFVRLYVSNDSLGWTTFVYPDEGNQIQLNLLPYDQTYAVYPPGAAPIDGPGVAEVILAPTGATGGALGIIQGPLMAYRFLVQVMMSNDTNASDLLAFDVCYSDLQEPDGISR